MEHRRFEVVKDGEKYRIIMKSNTTHLSGFKTEQEAEEFVVEYLEHHAPRS